MTNQSTPRGPDVRRLVLLAAVLTLCLPSTSWADAHLLLNFKDSKDYPVPFWVAIREGWSELPTVHTHQLELPWNTETACPPMILVGFLTTLRQNDIR